MENVLGLLKVRVVKGRNMAVRDFSSSDPFVVVKLANQTVRTRVVKKNLNPVWDEELTLSVPDPTPPLKLQVMDKDRFSKDESLGEADLDLQPLVAAAAKYEGMNAEKEKQEIERVLASRDNTFTGDSLILLTEGNLIQCACLKLKNAESGEIEIELRWVHI
uniref:TSA: Wollemia nobilis Ref_Wollemi_Transcript_9548_835 transcribed RNA sequence n=1 Tax=Wollemia nobilis TaxID=56998 RepID=A0A0C9RN45_9CONI